MAQSTAGVAYERSGHGEPLLLIHGVGMSRLAWKPVLPLLSAQRGVIVIDLPGHGESPPAPSHITPAPPGFARLLAALLDELGIERAHVAGNSLGGWTALELARLGRARSVVAFGPAGFWERGPVRPVVQLSMTYRAACRFAGLAPRILRFRAGRRILLRHTFGHPSRVPAGDAIMLARGLANASAFHATLVASHMQRFEGGHGIDVPVSIVYGGLDRVVPAAARRGEELPVHTTWHNPPGLGHVPMWDDPALVARLILDGS